MTSDQTILFALFGLVFALLLWGRFRYDLVAFGALLAGVVLGVVPTKDAFAGFGHPATVIVAQRNEPVPTPSASAVPDGRPTLMDVPMTARMLGPGLMIDSRKAE